MPAKYRLVAEVATKPIINILDGFRSYYRLIMELSRSTAAFENDKEIRSVKNAGKS